MKRLFFGLFLLLATATHSAQAVTTDVFTRRVGLTPPSSQRSYGFLAFDSLRRRLVRFGGYDGNRAQNDMWSWDGSGWTALTPATLPPKRFAHGNLVYDDQRDRVVLFGGRGNGITLDDTWEFDGSDWAEVTTTSQPSKRNNHAIVYDAARGQVLLFGGYDTDLGVELDDTWSFDGTNWTQLSPAAHPSIRGGALMAYDAERERVVLFGGWVGNGHLGDTWEWDGTNWEQRFPATGPPQRALGGITFDGSRKRTLMFGGWDGAGWRRDLWEWDGSDWRKLSPRLRPSARCCPGFTYDEERGRVLLFGGCDNRVVRDTWELYLGSEASFRAYPSRPGTPRLEPEAGALPWLGEDFELELKRTFVAPWSVGIAGLGLRGGRPLAANAYPGLVQRVFALHLLPGASSRWTLSIPAEPSLMGTQFFLQFAAPEPGTGNVLFSNPVAALVGAH